jgi:hypothetical protein
MVCLVPLILSLSSTGCGTRSAESPANLPHEGIVVSPGDVPYTVWKTPNGRTLKIRVLGMDLNNHPELGKNLVFRYRSDLPLGDAVAIRAEVDDVWSIFVKDCDRSLVETAVIQVSGAPTGALVSKKALLRFIYKKANDGEWRFQRIDEQTQYSLNGNN